MKLISLQCPGCGATLQVDDESSQAVCQHCNTSFIIDKEI